jgi:hypothetical protein
MRMGNKLGVVALLFLALALTIAFSKFDIGRPLIAIVSLCSTWAGILLLICAGIKGSRWWLTVPVAILSTWLWALSRGH